MRKVIFSTWVFFMLLSSCSEGFPSYTPPETNTSYYSITYNGNGNTSGDVPIDENKYKHGSYATIKDKGSMDNEGYIFRGWGVSASGTIVYYKGNEREMMFHDLDLYALWGEPGESTGASDYVYITPTGSKYHRSSCSTIKNSQKTAVTRSDAISRGLGRCSVCNP